MPDSFTIALDAMGGDHAPACVVEGAELALRKSPKLRFAFVGDEAKITPLLKRHSDVAARSTVIHTDEFVADEVKPSIAVRQGRKSSMQLAINEVKAGNAHAVISGGNTGALMAMSKLALRMLPGIKRPAAAGLFPTETGEVVMLDLGANLEANAEELVQFAIMGNAYARAVLGRENPSIGLLNVGEEDTKGHPEIREAAEMMRSNANSHLNFVGFVEGNQVPMGKVDVVVTDGFSGNVMLKTAEGTAKLMGRRMKEAFNNNWATKLSYIIASKTMGNLRKSLDPRRYNGAMFLGLNGVAVKSHGGSDAYGFSHAIRTAAALVAHDANQLIITELKASGMLKDSDAKESVDVA
ncbi:MAG: phosphate acyltransferase PlsX [Rickettsiales bacterium]|nr:phosphate acyltransferase PlsX [Rickettsiales bacterium]